MFITLGITAFLFLLLFFYLLRIIVHREKGFWMVSISTSIVGAILLTIIGMLLIAD